MNCLSPSAMVTHEESLTMGGFDLHRLVLIPPTPRAGLIFHHGQGDYIDRYSPVLTPFLEKGIVCLLTDFPGHGRSSGKRGGVPGMNFIDALLDDSVSRLRQDLGTDFALGIAGHSAGGLVAQRSLLRQPDRFSFAWFSSPLLDIKRRSSPWSIMLMMLLSHVAPRLRRSTGVKASDCRTDTPPSFPSDSPQLHHDLVTLSWARDLIKAADFLAQNAAHFPTRIPILFTQGEKDPICPPDILRTRLSQHPGKNITLKTLADGLHEPFVGDTAEEFVEILCAWLADWH